MKDETGGVAIEEFIWLTTEMYSTLLDNNSEYKKAKGVNGNVVLRSIHKEYKASLLHNKCLKHSMNIIQS